MTARVGHRQYKGYTRYYSFIEHITDKYYAQSAIYKIAAGQGRPYPRSFPFRAYRFVVTAAAAERRRYTRPRFPVRRRRARLSRARGVAIGCVKIINNNKKKKNLSSTTT